MTGAALITGGRRGIGKGIALALAAEGFNIAINAEADTPDLTETVLDLRAMGVKAEGIAADISDTRVHGPLLKAAEDAIGPLNILVNNAGVSVQSRGDPLDVTPDSYDRCQKINTRAMFFLCQAFSKSLLGRRRDPALHHAIINITSGNATAVSVNRAEYCVSKAAASMVTKLFAVRLGPDNINVYEIQPGIIETDMTAPVMKDYKDRIAEGLTLTPRVGTADDIGDVASALATGKLAYCTGQALRADGGLVVTRF